MTSGITKILTLSISLALVVAVGAVLSMYLLATGSSIAAITLVRAMPLAVGVLVAGVVMVVGWGIKKRGLQKWQWDDDMRKVQALASAIVVFVFAWFVCWMPMIEVICKPLMVWTHSDRPPVMAVSIALATLPAAILAFLAYWCAKRFYAASVAGDDETGVKARKTARKVVWSMVGLAAILILSMALRYRGNMQGMFIALSCCVPAALLIMIGLFVKAAGWTFRSEGMRTCGKWYLALSLIWVSAIFSYPAGWLVSEWDVYRNKLYCESLLPELELYRIEHGCYPDKIGQLESDRQVPRMLRRQKLPFYWGNEKGFEFNVEDSRMFLNWWGYSSDLQEWHVVKF